MRENKAKKKLLLGETVFGVFANALSPELIEIMGISGLDFVMVDSEHSSSGPETNRLLNMAGECRGITMMTREPDKQGATVLRYLDAGRKAFWYPR